MITLTMLAEWKCRRGWNEQVTPVRVSAAARLTTEDLPCSAAAISWDIRAASFRCLPAVGVQMAAGATCGLPPASTCTRAGRAPGVTVWAPAAVPVSRHRATPRASAASGRTA